MTDELSTIRAVQKVISTWSPDLPGPLPFPEDFAIKRFFKKMETPDSAAAAERKDRCFQSYVQFDESLGLPHFLPKAWYEARLRIHQWIRAFKLGPVSFTNGSEAEATFGRNSVEQKLLRSRWDCPADCFDLWADTVSSCRALTRACRMRFRKHCAERGWNYRRLCQDWYREFSGSADLRSACIKRMLSHVTFIREASRFSTVRKNNETDRPIDIQALCAILVQRRIGGGLRELLRSLGYDLDSLQDHHRILIGDPTKATIDLKNASDSVQKLLCEFLFPKWFYELLLKSCHPYVEGLDGWYYITKKVSSMGNGFTFELMSLILLSLGLSYDPRFSVFGDDIIIDRASAAPLIRDLEAAGFVVNSSKSFTSGPFRESCGGNYHDEYGYIWSYDFEYPLDIHDCIVVVNKAYVLGTRYRSFKTLYHKLIRTVPLALQGPASFLNDACGRGPSPDVSLSSYFIGKMNKGSWHDLSVAGNLSALHHDPRTFFVHYGLRHVPDCPC